MGEAFCAAVDWGTSSFRIWLLARDGAALAVRRSSEGMTHCAPDRFAAVLEAHLDALGADGALPVVVCGMAGARQGWREAPYVDTPAPLDALVAGAVAPPGTRRAVRILPGICQRDPAAPDVMRGEETQLLGLATDADGNVTACLPGTHSKWVRVSGGRVLRMRSVMTGELFAAIGGHTILSHSLGGGTADPESPAFAAAVSRMMDAPGALTAELFSIRAGNLLGLRDAADGASTLSGLLIGAEIGAMRAEGYLAATPTLVSSGAMAALYRRAFAVAGVSIAQADAETAVLSGLRRAATLLFDGPTRQGDRP
jgi:2-dehydro-3-deoxygalactonokinase